MRRALRALGHSFRWLRLRPWTLAPVRLLRSPSLFLAIAVTAAVLGVAAGSRPLFVSSAGSGALHDDLTEGCAFAVGLSVGRPVQVEGVAPPPNHPYFFAVPFRPAAKALDDAVKDIDGVRPVVTTIIGPAVAVAPGTESPGKAGDRLIARTGAFDHVEVLDRVDEPGVWLTDTTATDIGVTAGQTVNLGFPNTGATVPSRVQGVYRDLTYGHDASWCSSTGLFEESFPTTPPRVILAEQSLLFDLARAAGVTDVGADWEYAPSPDGWRLSRARTTITELNDVASASGNDSLPLGKTMGVRGGASVDSQQSLKHAEEAAAAAESAIGPVALGTAGVAILMLSIAVRTWLDRRRKELTTLALRGAGAPALATKGVLELMTPMVGGALAGLLAGYQLVRLRGPSDLIETSALRSALLLVLAAVAACLATVLVVVVPAVRHLSIDTPGQSGRARQLLWEPVALAAAAAAYYELRTHGSSVVGTNAGPEVDSLMLLFPILLLAGGAGLFARLLLRGRLLWVGASRLPMAGRLAARRIVASRVRAAVVITGAAISIGLVVFAGSVRMSLQSTIVAKTTLGLGSSQIFRLDAPTSIDAIRDQQLARHATAVIRTSEANVLVRGHPPADVLGIDPATFEQAAFWDGSFAGRSLSSLVDSLASPAEDGALPAIAAGDGLPERLTLTLPTKGPNVELPVYVTARAEAFPGYGYLSSRPQVIVTSAALTAAGVVESPEIWIDSNRDGLAGELRAAGIPVESSARGDPDEQQRLRPQVSALRYIQVIGLTAGAVPLCGLGFYFGAVGRERRLGVALARKLGISRRTSLTATLLEVGAMLTAGLIFGIAGAWAAIKLLYRYIDPTPNLPPTALFRFDVGSVAFCAVALVVVVAVTTVLIERRTSRSSLPELLRYAT